MSIHPIVAGSARLDRLAPNERDQVLPAFAEAM
jgi:hypothetical protein